MYTAGGISLPVKMALFNETNSPLRFRSFISYLVDSVNSEPMSIEHSFYVSGVMNTREAPSAIMVNGNHGNQFYTSKMTREDRAAMGVALSAILEGINTGGGNNSGTSN